MLIVIGGISLVAIMGGAGLALTAYALADGVRSVNAGIGTYADELHNASSDNAEFLGIGGESFVHAQPDTQNGEV